MKAAPSNVASVDEAFVELWNNMGTLWGISPTMARIHGLLYISGEALSMDELMARLVISRGNVSMNLSKLVEWGLVHRVHKRGDRKEYFRSLRDVWEMFTLVAHQRKRREIDPMLTTLRQCRANLRDMAPRRPKEAGEVGERLARIDELLQILSRLDRLAKHFANNPQGLRAMLDLLSPDPD